MENKKLKIAVIIDDTCREDGKYSINDILAYDTLDNFIEKENPTTITAYEYLLHSERRTLITFLQSLRKLTEIEYDAFFLTPFGLINETKIIAPYKECLSSMNPETINTLLTETKSIERINSILLDNETKIVILILTKRITKQLRLDEITPSNKRVFLIINEPFNTQSENITIIYPNKLLEQKAKPILGLNGKSEFYEIAWKLIYKLLTTITTNKISLNYVITHLKDVIQITNTLTEITQTKQASLIPPEETTIQIITIPYEKLTVNEETNEIINRELVIEGENIIKNLINQGLNLTINIYVDKHLIPHCKKWANKLTQKRTKVNCHEYEGYNTVLITNQKGNTIKTLKSNKTLEIDPQETTIIITGPLTPKITPKKPEKTTLAIETKTLKTPNKQNLEIETNKIIIFTNEKDPNKITQNTIQIKSITKTNKIYIWNGEALYTITQNQLQKTNKKIKEIIHTK